ncbi:hypothetical protein B0H63DRAFT_519148 [Podospora didyma]|uniref:Uncharacterized protein n=1 Tax=Podospora didyma TaxID=330526 RepID=A0AAE0NY25_9PEZI|nr:hypothetical protein B0H63DRAFT_519148 [Podospora didyma]
MADPSPPADRSSTNPDPAPGGAYPSGIPKLASNRVNRLYGKNQGPSARHNQADVANLKQGLVVNLIQGVVARGYASLSIRTVLLRLRTKPKLRANWFYTTEGVFFNYEGPIFEATTLQMRQMKQKERLAAAAHAEKMAAIAEQIREIKAAMTDMEANTAIPAHEDVIEELDKAFKKKGVFRKIKAEYARKKGQEDVAYQKAETGIAKKAF